MGDPGDFSAGIEKVDGAPATDDEFGKVILRKPTGGSPTRLEFYDDQGGIVIIGAGVFTWASVLAVGRLSGGAGDNPRLQDPDLLEFERGGNILSIDALAQAGDQTLSLRDPGGPDFFVYEGLAQTLSGKTFAGATVTTSPLIMSGQLISSLADPISGSDAATKAYADSIAAGFDPKESVRLATDVALPANTASGSGVGKTLTGDVNGALSVDSVLVVVSDRILIQDEVTGSDNGIYTVTQVGDGSNPYILTRAVDFDQDAEVSSGAFTPNTAEGTINNGRSWVLIGPDPITVDSTSLSFVPTGVSVHSDLGGLGADDHPLYVLLDGTRGTYVGEASIITVGTITTGTWNGSTVVEGFGGTGETTYSEGDLLVGDAGSGLLRLTIGSVGEVLQNNGAGALAWQRPNVSDFTDMNHTHETAAQGGQTSITAATTGTLTTVRGGTGLITYAEGDLIIASAVDTLAALTIGSVGQVLQNDGAGALTWQRPNVSDFTDAIHNHEAAAGGGTLDIVAATTGTLTETRGGTGQSTWATGDLLYSDAANSLAKLGIGSTGQKLTVASGIPAWETINHQKEFYEGMNTQFLVFSDMTQPRVGFFPEVDGLQTIVAGGGAIISSATIDKSGHPGVWYFSTGSGAAGRLFGLSVVDSSFNVGSDLTRIGTWLKIGTILSTGAQHFTVRAGFAQINLPNTMLHGITFEYDHTQNGGRWQAITNDGTETSTDTGITVTADTWYDLQIEINADASSVEFFIDGVSVATNILNIPTGPTFDQFYSVSIMKLAGTSARHILVDAYFVYMELNR